MHYLTQHYKNRCIQLQEQVDALSYHLQRLQEASGMAATAADDTAQQMYSGEGLAAILNQFFNPATAGQAQANLDSYLRAWRAQSAGSGSIPARGIAAADQFNNRSTTAGRSVAAAARGIMAAGAGEAAAGSPRGFGASAKAPTVGGVANIGRGRGFASAGEMGEAEAFGGGGMSVAGGMGEDQGGGLPGDFNGDGRVDGADLGLALGGAGNFQTVLQNWTGPGGGAGSNLGSAAGSIRGSVNRRRR